MDKTIMVVDDSKIAQLQLQRILPDSNRYKQPLREKKSFVSPERLFDWR